MAKPTLVSALGVALAGVGIAGMLSTWLATLANDATLRGSDYLIPFVVCVALVALGIFLVLFSAVVQRSTRYGRLNRLYQRGKRLRRKVRWNRPWRERDLVLRIAWQVNEVAKWANRVDREMQNIAPEHAHEWAVRTVPRDTGPAPEMDKYLTVLDGIMQRVRAKDGGS